MAVIALLTVIVLSYGAQWIAPYDPLATQTEDAFAPPGPAHPLGADMLGRDVLSRLLFGGQRTLTIAFLATLLAALPGLFTGIALGYLDDDRTFIFRLIINAMLAIPGLVLALAVLTVLGAGAGPIALAVGISQFAPLSQVMLTAARQARSMQYVESAKALGAGPFWIMVRHILPTVLPVFAAYTAVTFSYAIINGAALSFLGLGGDPGVPDWGVMLADGRAILQNAPWVSIAPGLLIVITVVAVNRIAEL